MRYSVRVHDELASNSATDDPAPTLANHSAEDPSEDASSISESNQGIIASYALTHTCPDSPRIKAPNSASNITDVLQSFNSVQKLSLSTVHTVQGLCVLLKNFLTQLHVLSKN